MKPRVGETLCKVGFVAIILIVTLAILRFGSTNMRRAAEENQTWRMEWASRR